jgi:hypothetical protein
MPLGKDESGTASSIQSRYGLFLSSCVEKIPAGIEFHDATAAGATGKHQIG